MRLNAEPLVAWLGHDITDRMNCGAKTQMHFEILALATVGAAKEHSKAQYRQDGGFPDTPGPLMGLRRPLGHAEWP